MNLNGISIVIATKGRVKLLEDLLISEMCIRDRGSIPFGLSGNMTDRNGSLRKKYV